MKRLAGVLLLFTLAGCDNDRLAKLEKQTAALESQLAAVQKANQLDLQAKCSKDAKVWFDERWASGRDRNTLILDFTNHYNLAKNKCFVQVEFRFTLGSSWAETLSVFDVYENQKYGDFSERHTIDNSMLTTCEVYGKKCQSLQEYQSLTAQFMSN